MTQESAPLLELEKEEVKWSWENKQEVAFLRVKELFSAEVLLYHPSRDRPLHLISDASTMALGVLLLQKGESEASRIITMASRTLKDAELNYCFLLEEAL